MLDDREVLARTQMRVRDAVGFLDSTLTQQREKALKYYRGDPFGNEIEGRSQVVSHDVAQYIDTVMPSLMRVFASGDEVVRFEPAKKDSEDDADAATDYCNWIWNQQNPGFTIFHDWFKDGLLNKLGVIKIYWDTVEEQTRENYEGLTEAEYQAMMADDSIEIGDAQPVPVMVVGPDGMPTQGMGYNVTVTRTNKTGRVRIQPVPPEEFLFGRRAKSTEDADVLGHRGRKSKSDLIELGFPKSLVDTLFTGDDGVLLSEQITRFADVDDAPLRYGDALDNSTEVEVIEAYLRLDRDGDGIAEYLKVMYSGNTVLDIEEVDDHPFACLSPILMPHRLAGQSMADQLFDVQMTKSTLLRQQLDNMYLTNMPQMGIVDGQVNLDDALTRRPGGIIRMKQQGALFPIATQQLGGEPFQMIEYWDTVAEQRTGATRYNQGLDPNSLNKTATGINLIQNAAAQRIELIARIYAETGVKRAFKRILQLVCQHQDQPKTIRLRGKWVDMDPRTWDDAMDMVVTVGLGNGNKDQIVAHMMTLLNMDKEIIQLQGGAHGPLLTMENVYAKLKQLVVAIGLKSVEPYYSDPANPQQPQQPPAPPPPDPKMIEAQGKIQLAQQEMQGRMQLEQQKAQDSAALEQWRSHQQMQLDRERMLHDMEMARQKFQADVEVKRMTAQAAMALQAQKAEERAEGVAGE